MEKPTIEQAFVASSRKAESMSGREFQAVVGRKAQVDSSNINSIIRKDKGASEDARRRIFEAIIDIVDDFPARSYEEFLSYGAWLCINGDKEWPGGSSFFVGSQNTTQTNTTRSIGNMASNGPQVVSMDDNGITLTGYDQHNPPPAVDKDAWSELMHWIIKHPSMVPSLAIKARELGSAADEVFGFR